MRADDYNRDLVEQLATEAGYASAEEHLQELQRSHNQRQAIKRGLAELDAGLARPLIEYEAECRSRHPCEPKP